MAGFDMQGFVEFTLESLERFAPQAPRFNNPRGMQDSHQIGSAFRRETLPWFSKLVPAGPSDVSLFRDPTASGSWNFARQPETYTGQAFFGTAAHLKLHVNAYNNLAYSPTGGQFLNTIEILMEDVLRINDQTTRNAELAKLRLKVITFADFLKFQQLDQAILDKTGIPGLKTTAFNKQDMRFGSARDVSSYLDSIKSNFTFEKISNNDLFKDLLNIRTVAGEGAVESTVQKALIKAHPDFGRLLFPDGKAYLTPQILADVSARQMAWAKAVFEAGSEEGAYRLMAEKLASAEYGRTAAIAEVIFKKALAEGVKIGELGAVTVTEALQKLQEVNTKVGLVGMIKWVNQISKSGVGYFDNLAPEMKKHFEGVIELLKKFKVAESGAVAIEDATGWSLARITVDATEKALAKLSQVDLIKVGNILSLAAMGTFAAHTKAQEVGGFTKPEFLEWAATEVVKFVVLAPIVGRGVALLGSIPIVGQVLVFSVGFVGGFALVKSLAGSTVKATVKVTDPNTGIVTDTGKLVYPPDSTVGFLANRFLENYAPIEKQIVEWGKQLLHFVAETQLGLAIQDLIKDAVQSVQYVAGAAAGAIITHTNEWLFGNDNSLLIGDKANNILIHLGYGKVLGADGDDALIGWTPKFIKKGEKLDIADKMPNATGATGSDQVAEEDLRLTLDGGDGNDWVITVGGKEAVTIGGKGRDWIFNTSKNGVIYGDTIDGLDSDTGEKLVDGKANSDNFWFWPGVTIKDAGHYDVLKFYGLPLTGGNIAVGGAFAEVVTSVGGYGGGALALAGFSTSVASGKAFGGVFWDNLLPFITYIFDAKTNTMYVANVIDGLSSLLFGGQNGMFNGTTNVDDPTTPEDETQNLTGFMRIQHFDFWGSYRGDRQLSISGIDSKPVGTLNMVFKQLNPVAAIIDLLPPSAINLGIQAAFGGGNSLIDAVFTLSAATARFAKAVAWAIEADPLVLDLDGNGIEFSELRSSRVYFDLDGDKFRERTAWLNGSDGFLAVDANGNGRIDDISELFGGVGVSGLGELAGYDSNNDGVVDALDAKWAELRVWRDLNQNGVTDAGELQTLEQTGIVSLTVTPVALDLTTPQGVYLSDYGSFTRTDGTTGRTFDAVLPMDNVDTKYAGESGRAAWQQPLSVGGALLDAKGFGTVTNLAVAAANDIALGELATQTAATMTVPKLKTLVTQAGAVLGAWGAAMPLTQELVAVRLGLDANGATVLLDRAVYVEDATGGFWKLHSNAAVLDAQGNAIARATLEDIVAQGTDWQLEQAWSPSTRGTAVQYRDPAPYLVQIVAGRAVVLDHGVEQADGSWRLASGAPVLDASGNVILAPTRDDIMHQAHAAGLEWRVEQIGFNPNANLPVAAIGVRFTDGHVVDYTVLVTDRDGAFYVWARNLDRALELEAKTGDSREFNLRNYEVDFAHLDEVGSTDDSQYRVELLTPAQFQFAMSLGGLPFRSEMLTATLDYTTGHLAYTVNATAGASLSADHYESEIKTLISLLEVAMHEYIIASRRFAVRLALQDGLKEYADGLKYDATTDRYRPTTDRELAPLFEAIFRDAPITNTNDAVFDYLADWNEILWQVYPDYSPSGKGNLLGGKLQVDQAFIFQMLIPAFEKGIALDLYAVAHALSIDDQTIRAASATSDGNTGTDGTDSFYMTMRGLPDRRRRAVNPVARSSRRARAQLSPRTLAGVDSGRLRNSRKCVAA